MGKKPDINRANKTTAEELNPSLKKKSQAKKNEATPKNHSQNHYFPRFVNFTYNSIPTKIHSSLVMSSSNDEDEESEEMLEKLPLRPELLEEKLSLLVDEALLLIEGDGSQ